MDLKLITLFIGLISMASCYKAVDGCLDPLASNLDVSSDTECTDCCTYPEIILSMNHIYQDTSYQLNDTLINNLSDTFAIIAQKMYINNIELLDITGAALPLLDSTNYISGGVTYTKLNDIRQINQNASKINVNKYRSDQSLHSVSLSLGLVDFYTDVDRETLPNNHVLITTSELYDTINQKYHALYFKIAAGFQLQDTFNVWIDGSYNFKITYPADIPISKGNALEISVIFNYNYLFDEVSFLSADSIKISEQMTKNILQFIK